MNLMHPLRLSLEISDIRQNVGYLHVIPAQVFRAVHLCQYIEALLNYRLSIFEVINALIYLAEPGLDVRQGILNSLNLHLTDSGGARHAKQDTAKRDDQANVYRAVHVSTDCMFRFISGTRRTAAQSRPRRAG